MHKQALELIIEVCKFRQTDFGMSEHEPLETELLESAIVQLASDLSHYDQAVRELPGEPSCIGRGTGYQQSTAVLDYIDALCTAYVAQKARADRYAKEFALKVERLGEAEAALATARAQERERCAKNIERHARNDQDVGHLAFNQLLAMVREIRALK